MAERPSLHIAVAKTKSKASEYNDNFDMMLDYIDASIDEAKDYVDGYMPAINAAAKGKFLTNDGTDASWASLASQPFGNIINGLEITKSTDDTIAVSAGSCYDSTGIMILTLGSNTTKQNESQSANTTYYVYIIGNGTTTDILIDDDTPTLPTGYTKYRQIGKYTTNSDGEIEYIYQGSSANPDTQAAIIETYRNGSSGYNLYSDNSLVQWFRVNNSSSTTMTADLLKAYGNTDYTVVCSNVIAQEGSVYPPTVYVKSNDKFTFYVIHGTNAVLYTDFVVIGYIS